VDLEGGRLLDLVADRTRAAVDGWLGARTRDWLAQVGTVALDPWRGYGSALTAPLGHAVCPTLGAAPGVVPSPAVLEFKRKAGLTTTSLAAVACGVGDRKGRVAPDFDADLLLVDGDPITDITALRRIAAVYVGGQLRSA
jgi:hypothetical protein